ncbi:MAG: hypothetical protein ACJ8DK_13735 [Microvirga sp.]
MRRVQLYNAAAVAVGTLIFFAMWLAVEHATSVRGKPLWAVVLASPFFHAVLGTAAFFVFRGHALVRVGLASVIPLLAAVAFEVTVGSDPAYPYIALVMGALSAVTFFVGAVAAAGMSWVLHRVHARGA